MVHWRLAIMEAIYFLKDHSGCEGCIVVRQEWKQRSQLGDNVLGRGCGCLNYGIVVGLGGRWIWRWTKYP